MATLPTAAIIGRMEYVASERHTVQVDFDDHLHTLENERRAERARRQGFGLPVPARAQRERVAA
jgi:hypothetical protein